MHELWKEVFGIIVLSCDARVADYKFYEDFDWKVHLNLILKPPRLDDNFDKLSTGHLKRNHRILQWIISHVLHLNKGGHSRNDNAKVISYIFFSMKLHCSQNVCHRGM